MADVRDEARERLLVTSDPVSGPTFTNQGQIDWISLAKVTVSASVAVMARLSGAGVDPFTVAVGQAVASRFRLSQLGTHRLDSTLQKLHCVSGIGDVLWFGFGINYIVRSLAKTNEGVSLVMLCSALVEVHSVQYGARVLHELTRLYSSSDSPSMTPSLHQWASVIHTCAGILSASSFGSVVETMMSLDGTVRAADVRGTSDSAKCRKVGDPKDLAAALRALAQLSQGEKKSIILVGGAECGWVAAVAYWFLELSIEIKDSRGKLLYSGTTNESHPQLTVIYDTPNDRKMQIVGQSYLIKDITRDILLKDNIDTAKLTSRISWDKAIQQTFGPSGTKLLKMEYFGIAVGSAARIFLAFARAEPCAQLQYPQLRSWNGYADSSYGRGFLNLICTWLPETAEQRPCMETAVDRSYEEAVARYQTALLGIAEVCNCRECNYGMQDWGSNGRNYRPFCLPLLCEAMIRLAWHFSILHLDTPILPSRAGLELVYHKHRSEFGVYHRRHEYGGAQTLIEGLDTDASFDSATLVFAGQDHADSVLLDRQFHKSRPAVVVSGICFYRDILREISDMPGMATRIHVIPGRIESKSGRSYSYLNDSDHLYTEPIIRYSASPPIPVLPRELPSTEKLDFSAEVLPIIEETATTLEVYYHIEGPHGTADVGPHYLMRAIVDNSGLIPCSRQDCSSTIVEGIPMALIKGEGAVYTQKLREDGHNIALRRVGSTPLARSLALLVLAEQHTKRRNSGSVLGESDGSRRDSDGEGADVAKNIIVIRKFARKAEGHEVLMQHSECTPCTIRAAVELCSEDKVVYVVLR